MKMSLASKLKWLLVGPIVFMLSFSAFFLMPAKPTLGGIVCVLVLTVTAITGLGMTIHGWFVRLEIQDYFIRWMDK